jgi:uncharacterized cupin superfamily protein
MVPEAKLRPTGHGLVPEGEGWYVLNAREAAWLGNEELSTFCHFEGDVGWRQLGLNVCVVEPGHPNCMYHDEPNQEGYLILSGEAIVIVQGQERRVKQWDYVHLPPWTEHVLVGTGDGPCVIAAVGARSADGGAYRTNPVAQKHGAAVDEETPDPARAYARFSPIGPRQCPEGVLPEW